MWLARAITLIESNAPRHLDSAQALLRRLLPDTGRSIRIGITGVPGVGKSTFIEVFGLRLCEAGHRVAVLTVDPSSSLSGGSVLGDKTRMEKLSRHPAAFIRPSPAGGNLGGVARKTRESLLVCEAAGFDVVLVETVGVGQSEVAVRSMVDFFLLLMLAGAGDELQGMKKGIMEMADAVAVTKADGLNAAVAEAARLGLEQVLHVLTPATEGWRGAALSCSALTGLGIDRIQEMIADFRGKTIASGALERRRKSQARSWLHHLLDEQLRKRFFDDPVVKEALVGMERAVMEGEITPTSAARVLLDRHFQRIG